MRGNLSAADIVARNQRRNRVAMRRANGESIAEIARNENISQGTVKCDWQAITKRWEKGVDRALSTDLHRLDRQYLEAITAYHDSGASRVETHTVKRYKHERVREYPLGADGKPDKTGPYTVIHRRTLIGEVVRTVETGKRDKDSRFLEQARRVLEMRAKIFGHFQLKQLETGQTSTINNVINIDPSKMSDTALQAVSVLISCGAIQSPSELVPSMPHIVDGQIVPHIPPVDPDTYGEEIEPQQVDNTPLDDGEAVDPFQVGH